MTAAEELRSRVQGEIDDSTASREGASRDASLFKVMPEVVFSPNDAADIAAAVTWATEKKSSGDTVSLTARSAGTDMSGGPLNNSVIVNMTPHFNHILDVSDGHATVEPGVFFRDFDRATKEKGWELPSYTASREINTVGGMVANDSGGEKNLKFGKTDRYVQELDVVLSDGQVHTLQKLTGAPLEKKLKETSFEGELYRRMAALVSAHTAMIQSARPKVTKNSSGYHLWEIGDGVDTLDLCRLMSGAQGTLGIITKIKFSLVKPQKYSSMVVMMLPTLADLGKIVPEVLNYHPDSFESYDDNTFKLAVKYFPEFAAQMKAGFISLGLSFLPELVMVFMGGVPKIVLLIEFRDEDQAVALKKAEELATEMKKNFAHARIRVAKTEQAARKYWVMRRESFNLLRKKIRGMRTAPFIDDFVVPPSTLPEFLPKLQAILDPYKLIETVAGHVGDGNFHIIPLIDPNDPRDPQMLDELSHKVYDLVLSYNGSITGEHNDGIVRTPYVEKMFGKDMYSLFKEVKKIFDPLDIFNPGKKVDGTFEFAKEHLDLTIAK
jgi:FAD/FMN-containing dehydrogenase